MPPHARATADVWLSAAAAGIKTARTEFAASREAFATQLPLLAELCTQTGFVEPVLSVPDEEVAGRLAALHETAQAERAALAPLLEQSLRLRAEINRLPPEHAAAATSLEHARTQAADSVARREQRRSSMAQKAAARANLLHGETTAAHRTRINDSRRQARDNLAAVRAAAAAAAAAFQAAVARCEEADTTLEAERRRVAFSQHAFEQACETIGRETDLAASPRGKRDAAQSALEMG